MLTVTSYEGDADYYEKEVLSGLTLEDVKFYLAFLSPFKATWKGGLYGNTQMSMNPNAPLTCLVDALGICSPTSPGLLSEVTNALNNSDGGELYAHDMMVELIGTWNKGYFYRTFACHRVHYVPQECLDVTSEFKL